MELRDGRGVHDAILEGAACPDHNVVPGRLGERLEVQQEHEVDVDGLGELEGVPGAVVAGHAALGELHGVVHRIQLEGVLWDVDAARQGIRGHQGVVVVPVPAPAVHLNERVGLRENLLGELGVNEPRVLHGVDGRLSDDEDHGIDHGKLCRQSGHSPPFVFYLATGCRSMREAWNHIWPILIAGCGVYWFGWEIFVAGKTGIIKRKYGFDHRDKNPFGFWFEFVVRGIALVMSSIMMIAWLSVLGQ